MTLIQSHIQDPTDPSRVWFVSTALRNADCAAAPDLEYYETLSWKKDCVTGERVENTLQAEAGNLTWESALETHHEHCESLLRHSTAHPRQDQEIEF